MAKFIPTPLTVQGGPKVPYFEDAKTGKHGIKGVDIRRPMKSLIADLHAVLGRLGGGVKSITPGVFEGEPQRDGFRIEFFYGQTAGRIEVAALPLRGNGRVAREQAEKQAISAVVRMLQSQYDSLIFMPDAIPLVPFLIGPDGRTVTEALIQSGNLPLLDGGYEGEYVD